MAEWDHPRTPYNNIAVAFLAESLNRKKGGPTIASIPPFSRMIGNPCVRLYLMLGEDDAPRVHPVRPLDPLRVSRIIAAGGRARVSKNGS